MLVKQKKTDPTLSMWLIFLIGAGLSLTTHLSDDKTDVLGSALNIVDVLAIFTIIVGVMIFGKNKEIRLQDFEKKYLAGALYIVLFWQVFDDAFTSNLLVQVLMTFGYFPTTEHMVRSGKNTESFKAWGLALSASIVGFYPPYVEESLLGQIYVARSFLSVIFILCLMTYFERRARKK